MQVWVVEYTDQFDDWYQTLTEEEQDMVVARVELLEFAGPRLGRPVVDSIHKSRHPNMKELRRKDRSGRSSPSILDGQRSCSSEATRAPTIPAARTGTVGMTTTYRSPTPSTTNTSANCARKD